MKFREFLNEALSVTNNGVKGSWKQTNSITAKEAEKKYGKENVRVKKKGNNDGSDTIEIFEKD